MEVQLEKSEKMGGKTEELQETALEIWGVRGGGMGQQLRGREGIEEGFGFGFGLLCSCVLFYFLKWKNPERVCTLELALFSRLCAGVAHQ